MIKKLFVLIIPVTLMLIGLRLYVLKLSKNKQSFVASPSKIYEKPKEANSLSIINNIILDKDGNPIQLIGVISNEFRYSQKIYNSIDDLKRRILYFKNFGVNLVVLYLDRPPSVDARKLEIINLADWVRDNDMYILLYPVVNETDPSTGKKTAGIQYSPSDQRLDKILGYLSNNLKNNKSVLYGTGAEPHNITPAKLLTKQKSLINIIRESNPEAIVVVNGLGWGSSLDLYLNTPLLQKNILYDIHLYNSHNKSSLRYENCRIQLEHIEKLPIILGEFGGVYGADFGSEEDLKCTNMYLDSLATNQTSFAIYTMDPESDLSLLTDDTQLTPKGQIFVNALKQ